MPEFIDFDPGFKPDKRDSRDRRENPDKRGKSAGRRSSGNVFAAAFLELIPQKGDSTGDVCRKVVFLLGLVLILVSSLKLVDYYFLREQRLAAELDEVIRLRDEAVRNAPVTLHLDSDGNLSAGSGPALNKPLEILPEYADFAETVDDFIGWV